MAQYAVSLLLTSLVMSAIILAILLVGALFPKAFPAKLRYAVWLVILAGLIIPLRPVIGSGTVAECELDYENGRKVYEIKIIYRNTKYEMDVDANDGTISDYSSETLKGSAGSGKHHNDSDHDHDD